MSRISAFAVFRNRSFTLLWTSQLISEMGSGLSSIAASILVFRLTGSSLSVGLMLMATALPSVVVGLIAGVFVDRWDHKKILIVADLLRAVLAALIPVLAPLNIVWLYVIVALSSTIGQFYAPAHASILPELASEDELTAATSMMNIGSFGATAIGFILAGLIASQAAVAWAFYLNALSFVLSAFCVMPLRGTQAPADDSSVGMVLANLRAGAALLINTPILRSLFMIFIPVFISAGLTNALLLPFALRALHATEFEYSLLEGLFAAGFVASSMIMIRLADRLHEGQWITLGLFGMAAVGITFASLSSVPIALAVVSVEGLVSTPLHLARKLVIQRHTPREMRGRVNSAFYLTRDAAFLLGMAAAGLADLYNIRLVYLGGVLLVLSAGLLALLMPGLSSPVAEWRQAVSMLRMTHAAPGLGLGRAATPADFGRLAGHVPLLRSLSMLERAQLIKAARVYQAPSGTAIVRYGDTSDAAYFILDGRALAGRDEAGSYRALEVLSAGDFFGEIAALTGAPRTANVVAEQPITLLQLPATVLRQMLSYPQLHRVFVSQMTTRMARMSMVDLPRFAGVDQATLRELRTSS